MRLNNISYVKLHELLDCLIKYIFKKIWDIWWIESVMRIKTLMLHAFDLLPDSIMLNDSWKSTFVICSY